MQRSIQGIAFSMNNQAERMNVIANNIANINTRAYKKETLTTESFEDVMLSAIEYNSDGSSNPIGSISFGAEPVQYTIDFTPGNLQETGYNTDFAIRGDGFFALDTPQGTRYTRAGVFTFDKDGYLVTQSGDYKCYVMGENGRIQSESKNISVNEKGYISGGDRLSIVSFVDLRLLVKSGVGLYENPEMQNLKAPTDPHIMQGYLEDSNVSVVEETRNLLDTKRNYESCQQIIRMIDDIYGKAVNDIGRI